MTSGRYIPVIGLVGGIGAGKSTVASRFADEGCAVLDADRIGHVLLADPEVDIALRRRWGEGIFATDGSVARKALGEIVFADPAELAALNAILHPRIRERLIDEIAGLRCAGAVRAIVVDAAVLFEAGWDDLCDRVVFVDAPPSERLARVKAQRGWSERQWRTREKTQKPLDSKRSRCSDVVDNSSRGSCLLEQIRQVLQQAVPPPDLPDCTDR